MVKHLKKKKYILIEFKKLMPICFHKKKVFFIILIKLMLYVHGFMLKLCIYIII